MFQNVIFDLDGTLLNTIDDLADAANWVCARHGWPLHTVEEYKRFVSNGIPRLVERFAPAPERTPEGLARALEEFSERYGAHRADKTAPYAGMPEAVERLGLYCRRLLEKNQVMNLTALTDPADVMTLHFLDSAALLPTRALGGRKLIDVGTGAGFPGLVLRILDPTIRLTLLDSLGKRVEWLTELCRELDLPDVVLLKGRAEELSRRKTHREQYDVAVSRALAAMPMLAELCLPYVKPGGLFLAMKSNKTDEEIAGAEKIIQALGGEKPFVMDYLVPGTEVYHRVVTVFKARPTPGSYPRKWTKIKETKV